MLDLLFVDNAANCVLTSINHTVPIPQDIYTSSTVMDLATGTGVSIGELQTLMLELGILSEDQILEQQSGEGFVLMGSVSEDKRQVYKIQTSLREGLERVSKFLNDHM